MASPRAAGRLFATIASIFFSSVACGSDSGGSSGSQTPGGTCSAPACQCTSCFDTCVCATGDVPTCLSACGINGTGATGGQGGSGQGGFGGTGVSGSGGESGTGQGGSGQGGSGQSGAGGSGQGGSGQGGAGAVAGVGGASGGGSGGTGGGPPPPGDVMWLDYPEQHTESNGAWGTALTDIARHLPTSYGNTYRDSDLVTFGHETTHGINAHLRNNFNNTGKRANAFYVLHDRAAIVIEPGTRKSDANPHVPQSLRAGRYNLYMAGSQSWDDTPLYIWDEWVSYANGTEVGLSLHEEGKWTYGQRDQFGNIEFVVYGLAVGMAVEEKDPSYFQSNDQFRAFLKWQVERSMDLHHRAAAIPDFAGFGMAAHWETMKNSADAEQLREFARRAYGPDWANQVLGF